MGYKKKKKRGGWGKFFLKEKVFCKRSNEIYSIILLKEHA